MMYRMIVTSLLLAAVLCPRVGRTAEGPTTSPGQPVCMETGNFYQRLYTPQTGRSAQAGDLHKTLRAGQTLTLANLRGPGVIGSIDLTHMNHKPDASILASRGVILRCFWDGEDDPSVEVPLNDFFGIGFGGDGLMNTLAWQRDGGGHMRVFLPMPFKKQARIELTNLTDQDLHGFYWFVEYDKGVALPEDLEYFHAQYRQSQPVPKNSIHTVLEVEGRGKYVGTVWSVNWLNPGTPPENAFSFFVDGSPIDGTNSEDFFGQSWGFRETFSTLCVGQSLRPRRTDIGSTQMTSYRIHFPNPVLFQKSLRFTMDCQQYNFGYRTDSYDTVAFWYQSHPKRRFPKLPPLEELLPITSARSYWRGLWDIHTSEKGGKPEKALAACEELVKKYPGNARTPDVLFKAATLKEPLRQPEAAGDLYRQIIEKYPQSEAAGDARDNLWLQEKPGRMLMTLVTPSGWTAYLDGRKIELPPELFREKPAWGETVHYRYGRAQRLSIFDRDATPPALAEGDPIPIVSNPYSSTVYDKEDNVVQWSDSSSSIMRLFTLRLEPGSGKHLLAVEGRVSNDVPIRLESQGPGGLVGVLKCRGAVYVTDGTWRVSEKATDGWQNPKTPDEAWETASVYTNAEYGDGTWFWLHPAGLRKFSGDLVRIWNKERSGKNCSVYFRKSFIVP